MSMTAYNILECRKQDNIYVEKKKRGKRAQRENDLTSARSLLSLSLSLRRGTADSLERRCSIDRLSRSERARISFFTYITIMYIMTHARRAKGNPVPIPEPGSGTAYNSGPRKSVRRGNPK